MATQTQAGEKMAFNSLNRTNQKLAKNPELSEHNKQVLEDFFSEFVESGAVISENCIFWTSKSTRKDDIPGSSSLCPYIYNFPLK